MALGRDWSLVRGVRSESRGRPWPPGLGLYDGDRQRHTGTAGPT